MYEQRQQPVIGRRAFARRMLAHGLVASALIVLSIALGMAGYIGLEGLSAVDAFLNTAMLLGGMGPVNPPLTTAGKLFAGVYALFAGLVFVVTTGVMITPVLHRVLHRFHWSG